MSRVRDQYEALPYPSRDPADERKRLITGSPGALAEVEHMLFAGRIDRSQPFRVLFAGGGTGDGTIMMAQQMADAGQAGEVAYVDLSIAARRVAEARARMRGLTNLSFHTGSLLDLAAMGLGGFDYIDCCGVLHHLPDPPAGLQALVAALRPGGGLGLMVYGRYGRTGVYEMQALLRQVAGEQPIPDQIATARRLLKALPSTNRLARNPFVRDHVEGGDSGLYDLLLHSQDRSYTVPELVELLATAGLAPAGFVEPAAYDPGTYVSDPKLLALFEPLPWIERCAAAERLAGSLKVHVVYVAAGDARRRVADPDDPQVIPVPVALDIAAVAAHAARGQGLSVTLNGTRIPLALPRFAAALLSRMDGRRTLADICADLGRPWDEMRADWLTTYRLLNGVSKLVLRKGT